MKSRYLNENELPSYDLAITKWLAEQEPDVSSIPYKIAMWHDERLYRSLTCSGMGEYIKASNFLESLGLKNLLTPDATFRGYDAVFVTLEDYKKARPTH
ncbi:hypothetical protein [Citrobacter portucalensis]|uniref:hypothetical protein n=1 Tax=Citrobacter portucalensis TaxID=1639133 RepID=UPI001910137B|nr:hypothetical protein [Citrobacter portucalensis]